MRGTWVVAMVVGVGLVVGGCGGDDVTVDGPGVAEPSGDTGGGGELAGRTFLSAAVTDGGQPRDLVPGTRIEVTFREDGRLGARAGCNSIDGTPTITAERITLADGAITEMACSPAHTEQDSWLHDLFSGGLTYALDGDRLTLTADTTTIELVDREIAEPDRPLEATVWTLDGMIDGDAVSSVPGDIAATVTFDPDAGTVAVEGTGCNGGGGDYTPAADPDASTGELTVGPLAWTRMACGEPSASVEAALGAVLDGTISYQVEAATLVLSHPGGQGLTLRAG